MNDVDGKVVIGTELETKSFDAQIKELENELNTMIKTLESDAKVPIELQMSEDERNKLESDIEKIKNKILNLREKTNEIGFKIPDNFNKGIKSLKKFGLSLFGIQSIYRLLSKASSAYLSQDTELAQKLQSVWVGLGSIVAPIIEKISILMLKGLGYLNEFVKALTGVDYVAKVNAKALDKQTKAQKSLNKATQDYDFDVIRKQQDTSSGTSGLNTSGLIQIPELNSKIVDKLKKLAILLKENWKWIKEVGIMLGITFGAVALGKLFANIGSFIGNKVSGLLGLKTILAGLAVAWVIKLYLDGYNKIKAELSDLKKELNEQTEGTKEAIETSKNYVDTLLEKFDELDEKSKKSVTEATKNSIEAVKRQIESNKKDINFWSAIFGTTSEHQQQIYNLQQEIINYTEAMKKFYDEGTISQEEYYDFIARQLPEIRNQIKDANVDTSELDKKINELTTNTKTAKIEIEVTAYDNASKTINNLLGKIKQGLGGLFGSTSLGKLGGGSGGRAFAKGGIVTQPTRALIGEAGYPEAVLPMTQDYLSTLASEIGKYNNGNDRTVNVYLDGRLIQRQVQKAKNNKDFATNN